MRTPHAGDVLHDFPADEILLVGPLPSERQWLDRDFERRARDLFGVPVSTVFGAAGKLPMTVPRPAATISP